MLLEMIDLMDNYRTARRREENAEIIDLAGAELGDMSQYSFKKFPYAFDQGYKLGWNTLRK